VQKIPCGKQCSLLLMSFSSFGDKRIFMRNTKNYTSWKV
jgi:hypothetical protein